MQEEGVSANDQDNDNRGLTPPARLRSPGAKARGLGVLLIQLGTPDAPTPGALRPYLKQFLSDPRVIKQQRWKWWPILNLIILSVRPGRRGRDADVRSGTGAALP